VPDEMKQYLRGRYGAAPGPVSAEILERVLGDERPITGRPADLVDETLEQYREELGDLARSEEDVLSYALFPQTARAYLERHSIGPESDVFGTHDEYLRQVPQQTLGPVADDRVKEILALVEQSDVGEVTIEEGDLRVTVRKATAPVASASQATSPTASAAPADASANGYHAVRSPMVGTFYRAATPSTPSFVEVGDQVKVGQTLCILEAMKLMNELASDVDGVVREIKAENGAAVEYGQVLFHIETA
jgi:oxaloacetate decarboxylase alpha subunit